MAGGPACATAPPLWRPRYPGLGHADGGTERCESWCSDQVGENLRLHCAWCDCRACAFCNAPPSANPPATPSVPRRARVGREAHDQECEQLVTIATHEVSAADHLVLQRLAAELRRPAAPHVPARTPYTIHDAAPSATLVESRPVKAQLWVMIYDEGSPSTDLIYNDSLSATISPGGWCVWGNKSLEAFFPRLANALGRHYGYLGEWPSYFRLYYFLSSALAIWDRTFAKAYPRLRYWWRMEPDVLFSGSLRTLCARHCLHEQHSHFSADCLLPGPFLSQRQMPSYSHWERNADISIGWPPNQILWSLVVVARYSRRMMDLLESSWDAGLFGFEEMSMPALCLTSPNCTLAKIGRAGIIEEEDFSYSTASHVQFRPFWSCEEYLSARMQNTHELWHPVKDRECLVSFFADQIPPTAPSPEVNRQIRKDVDGSPVDKPIRYTVKDYLAPPTLLGGVVILICLLIRRSCRRNSFVSSSHANHCPCSKGRRVFNDFIVSNDECEALTTT